MNKITATTLASVAKETKVGLVHSRFNTAIVDKMVQSCYTQLVALGVREADIDVVTVPGALEIPLALQTLAITRRYDALIAIGCVVRGETYHFEVVSNESCRGVSEVSLLTGTPIANGILTVNSDEEALARVAEKGADCANVAIEMANLMMQLANKSQA